MQRSQLVQFQHSASHPKMFQRLYFDRKQLLPKESYFETLFQKQNDFPNVGEQDNKDSYGR